MTNGFWIPGVILLGSLAASAGQPPATGPATRPALPVDHDEDRLSWVNELRLVDANTVFLKSDGMMVHRMTEDGGEYDDRHYIDGKDGSVHEDPKARAPDELQMKVGDRCLVGGRNIALYLHLLRIEHDRAVWQREEIRRNGDTIKDVISTPAYRVTP